MLLNWAPGEGGSARREDPGSGGPVQGGDQGNRVWPEEKDTGDHSVSNMPTHHQGRECAPVPEWTSFLRPVHREQGELPHLQHIFEKPNRRGRQQENPRLRDHS